VRREGEPAEGWFSVDDLGDGVRLVSEPFAHDFIRANFFIVDCSGETLVVDCGLGLARIGDQFPEIKRGAPTLLVTHAHNDHRGGAGEFDVRLCHRLEAGILESRTHGRTRPKDWPKESIKAAREAGYQIPDYMLAREPVADFDPGQYWIEPAPPTRLVDEGDVISVGTRQFRILHLPGHTPGGIGLFEERTGVFFSGDLLYDGPLVDGLPESNVEDFVRSVGRIGELPVRVMHGGHNQSVSGKRMKELADEYLRSKGIDPGSR
jgi:glyoxylase-like metal-dependent hydrolase (beta-lactamase superfamily II)